MQSSPVKHHTSIMLCSFGNLVSPKNTAKCGQKCAECGFSATNLAIIALFGSRFTPEDIQYGYDVGYSIITMDEYEEMGRAAAIQQIQEVLKGGPVYISLDIDGLDPAYLPGTGVPEIGGLIPRDVQVILRSLQGMDIIGADISEVSPCYDPTGITCVTVANLMFEMLCIIADSIAGKR